MLTLEKLKSILNYNKETGIFNWKISMKGTCQGTIAGNTRPDKYQRIVIDGKYYYSHRLAWMYVYGNFPETNIDHINRNPNDNRIKNLRLATTKQNLENTSISKKNKTGFKGVCWDKQKNKFRASITHNKKLIHIGFFANAKDASVAYDKKASEIFTHH